MWSLKPLNPTQKILNRRLTVDKFTKNKKTKNTMCYRCVPTPDDWEFGHHSFNFVEEEKCDCQNYN